MKIWFLVLIALHTLSGCVSQTVDKVVGLSPNDEICIINNPAVRKDFENAYRASIEKMGYKTKLLAVGDSSCEFTSTYVANYRMHWGTYLSRADLQIFKGNSLIGRAQYKAPRADPSKHGRVADKIDGLVKELFSQ